MKDRADYARKGIARGRPLIAVAFHDGVVFVSENPSRSLHKTSEIYDRIGFAAVGRYNEFEALRVAGIRLADIKGFQYARDDVSAKPLANAYSQALGQSFIGETKPFEVELVIAEIAPANPGDTDATVDLFHITYDGSLNDSHRFVVIGGDTEPIRALLDERFEPGLSRDQVITLACEVLAETTQHTLMAETLEVSGLDRTRQRRNFFRLNTQDLTPLLR